MTEKNRQSGFTIVEMLVVVAIVILVLAVGMPNVPGMLRSNKMSSAKNLIKNALAQAQSYAASNSKYAGIRFQKAANGKTYLVLIEHDPHFEWRNFNSTITMMGYCPFRYVAVPNAKPRPLQNGVAVVDGTISTYFTNLITANQGLRDYSDSANSTDCIENFQTFSIVFSPNGQLVTERVGVQPRRDPDGYLMIDDDNDPGTPMVWFDSIFGPASLATVKDNPDALLSYDNFYDYYDFYYVYDDSSFLTYDVNNSSSRVYYTADDSPSAWNIFYLFESTDNEFVFVDDQFEYSTTSLFVYMEEDMNDVPSDSRFTSYFNQADNGNETEGCKRWLINMYSGELMESVIQ